jgi:hypothetical protein
MCRRQAARASVRPVNRPWGCGAVDQRHVDCCFPRKKGSVRHAGGIHTSCTADLSRSRAGQVRSLRQPTGAPSSVRPRCTTAPYPACAFDLPAVRVLTPQAPEPGFRIRSTGQGPPPAPDGSLGSRGWRAVLRKGVRSAHGRGNEQSPRRLDRLGTSPQHQRASRASTGQALLGPRRAQRPATGPARVAAHRRRLAGPRRTPVRDTAGWVIVEDWINAQLLEADP